MSTARDYIPHNAAQFNFFLKRITQYVALKTTGDTKAWDHIPQAPIAELNGQYAKFDTAFNAAMRTPTHPYILARQEAQAEATRALRAFVNQYLRFPPVTNPERAEMGVPNHDTVRTDHKTVTEKVDYVIHLDAIRELVVDFWIKGSDRKAKPEGYDGAVIIWGIRDAPPELPEQLERHAMASRTPYTLHFEETERGKTVQIALAWQNERGILGEWSEYKDAVIP